MAPMLWLALKPTHIFHIVVSVVSTGDVALMLRMRDGSRGVSFGPEKVYTRCATPSARTIAALATMRARESITVLVYPYDRWCSECRPQDETQRSRSSTNSIASSSASFAGEAGKGAREARAREA